MILGLMKYFNPSELAHIWAHISEFDKALQRGSREKSKTSRKHAILWV